MSITSMSARANMAQKLSIPQLQQAIQDGVIPPYVGVPLLQEKVKMAKTAQAAQAAQAAQMGPQPSVTDQVMAEAQQVEQGVPALPTNLPASMAGGGIVAFAEGGMFDDEDTDEDRQDAARQAEMDGMMDEYAQSFQGGIGQLPSAQQYAPASEGKEDASDFVARIMHKESRGRRYGKDGQLLTSEKGAQGEMQVMPGTSRDPGFGVKPARDNSPDELARVGRDYAQTLLARYKDPKLAAIAYNMGPGATDKWLMAGADVSKLPKETQGYVKGFAVGGEVQHFAAGDLVYNPDTGMMEEEIVREGLGSKIGSALGDLINYKKGLTAGKDMPGMAKAQEQLAAALAARNGTPAPADIPRGRPTMANDPRMIGAPKPEVNTGNQIPAPAPVESPVSAVSAPVKADPYAKFEELFAKREENLGKQREQDKYMAMLQAGLGMMGGTSRHALANIGAGATQGIQSLAQSNAARTAEENALLSGRLGLAKIGSNKEYQDAMMAYRKELSDKTDARARDLAAQNIAEKTAGRTERDEAKALQRLSDISKNAEVQAEKAIAANPALNFAQDREAKKQAMIADILRRNSAYAKTYRGVHGPDADPFEGLGQAGGGRPTIKFDAQGNMIK